MMIKLKSWEHLLNGAMICWSLVRAHREERRDFAPGVRVDDNGSSRSQQASGYEIRSP